MCFQNHVGNGGSNLHYEAGLSLSECQNICKETPECGAMSHISNVGGCYIKAEETGRFLHTAWKSGPPECIFD